MINIISHRGLEPEQQNYFTESSFEAFRDQASRGFGLEFDVNFTADDGIIIFHDASLERITQGLDMREFTELTTTEVINLDLAGSHLCTLADVLALISKSIESFGALHLKARNQENKYLDLLLKEMKSFPDVLDRIIIFDVKPETARYLKNALPDLHLAPSVAHSYDIERYGQAVGGTLISVDEAIANRELFDWVWLDEWDRADKSGAKKTLYNQDVFDRLHRAGFKIALVTPELHATSPNLLAGESHPDAANKDSLQLRIKDIIELKPDAVCTDYLSMTKELILESVTSK